MAFIIRFAVKAIFTVLKALIKATAGMARATGSLAGRGGGIFAGVGAPRLDIKWKLVENRFPEIKRKTRQAMIEALEAAADTAEETAKRRAPVRTGRLHDSIHRTDVQHTSGGYTIAIVTDVPYAGLVEYGSVHGAAHSFLRPAARIGKKKLIGEIKDRFPKR